MSNDPIATSPGVLDSWLGIMRRRWKVGLGLFVAIFAFAAWLVLSSPPVYRAEARLRLGEPPPMSGVSPTAGIFGLFQLGGDPFANDLELLLSRTLMQRVVSDASLNATLVAPAGWPRDSIFEHFSAGPETTRATFELTWEERGVQVRRTAPDDSLFGTTTPGKPISVGDLTLIPRAQRPGMPTKVEIRTVPHGEAVRLLPGQLVIERARREANVVQLSFNSSDPPLAQSVVSSAIGRFIELRTAIQRRESGQTVDSLRLVANRTLAELSRAERDMEELQRRVHLIAPDAQNQAFIERYSEAVGQLESARTEFSGITSLLRRVSTLSDPADGWADLAAYPAFLENETVGELLSGLNRLNEERMELSSRRTTESREHQVLLEQIARRDASIRAIANGYRTSLQERIGLAETQVATMEGFLSGVPQQAIELGRHQRTVRVLSEVLVLTEQRLRQEELRQALTFANVQVIDSPALDYKPVWPRKKLGLGVGFLLASFFGALGVVVSERADRTVRQAREVRRLTGVPILGVTVEQPDGGIALTPREARAILLAGKREGQKGVSLAIIRTTSGTSAEKVARALQDQAEAVDGDHRPFAVQVMPAGTFSAAAAVDAPAILAVVCGRTGRDELRRTTELLRQIGAEILGTIVICTASSEATSLWQ